MLPAHRAIILADPDADKLIIYHNPTGAATFDPTITTSVSTTVIWETEVGRTVTTGTTHNLSYTPTAGAKKCAITAAGGLAIVNSLDIRSDAVTSFKNTRKTNIATLYSWYATEVQIADFPQATYINTCISGVCKLRGPVTAINRAATYISATWGSFQMDGYLSDFPRTLQSLDLTVSPVWSVGSGFTLHTSLRSVNLAACAKNQATVDSVISSVWSGRAGYTYAAPVLLIGGNNTDPSGSYAAPSEGPDWHEDSPGHWIPLTGKAMIYDLTNDVNGEGFNVWGITFTA